MNTGRPVELTHPYRLPPRLRGKVAESQGPLYPLLLIELYTDDGKSYAFEGLLDSGADDVLIPLQVAEMMGLPRNERVVSSGAFERGRCTRTRVGLRVGRVKPNVIDFGMIDAAFPETRGDIPILIGRDPLFRYFEVVFKEYRDRPAVTLSQKKMHPGREP